MKNLRFIVKVDKRNRIIIPSELTRILGIRPGDSVVLILESDGAVKLQPLKMNREIDTTIIELELDDILSEKPYEYEPIIDGEELYEESEDEFTTIP